MDKINCGGFYLGEGLELTRDEDDKPILNTSGGELEPATADTLGGVKIGDGIDVGEDGTISVSGGGIETFVATYETVEGVLTCDKTENEIKEALLAGKFVIGVLKNTDVGNIGTIDYAQTTNVSYLVTHGDTIWKNIQFNFKCEYSSFPSGDEWKFGEYEGFTITYPWDGEEGIIILPKHYDFAD